MAAAKSPLGLLASRSTDFFERCCRRRKSCSATERRCDRDRSPIGTGGFCRRDAPLRVARVRSACHLRRGLHPRSPERSPMTVKSESPKMSTARKVDRGAYEMNAQLQPTGSAYFIAKETEKPETHTLSVLVDNEPGVLARVIGLFSGRGYNIESLTVSETEHEKHLSRITIVTRGTPHVLEQIKHQLERIVPVHRVVDLSVRAVELGQDKPLARELALVKVSREGRCPRRGAAARRSVPRQRHRRQHRALHLRDHRQGVEDRAVHRHHEAARTGRSLPHRRGRHEPRPAGDVIR